MDSIGTRRPVIPLLVHEDCMGDIGEKVENIETNTDVLKESVGTTADGSSANTVIGLLKSISNKLTSF